MRGGQSDVVDYRNLPFERGALRWAVFAFAMVVVLIIAWDVLIWCRYGLSTLNSSLMAQGDFALPVVGGIAALGAGYGFFRTTYKGVPLFGRLPTDVKKSIEELSRPPAAVAPSGRLSAAVDVKAGAPVSEDTSAPSSGDPSSAPVGPGPEN